MSKAFLKNTMMDLREGSFLIPMIRREWARISLERSENFKWSEHINPSSGWLTFSGCPYEGIREAAGGRDANEADKIQYMEIGNWAHTGLQKWAVSIPDLLWPKPTFPTQKENDKLDKEWPESPFFWELFELSGRVDLVIKYRQQPAVLDIKIPQRMEGGAWDSYKKNLPEETHLTQSCMGALALKHMGVLDPGWVGVVYFNPFIPSKGNNCYFEHYRPFDTLLEEKTMLLLTHAKKERDAFLAGEESSCTYPGCKKHRKLDNEPPRQDDGKL